MQDEAPGKTAVDQDPTPCPGASLLSYPSTIALSTRMLTHLSDVIRAHRRAVRSRWRRLEAGQQALLVLAHLRNGDTYARLAGGFGVGIATVCPEL